MRWAIMAYGPLFYLFLNKISLCKRYLIWVDTVWLGSIYSSGLILFIRSLLWLLHEDLDATVQLVYMHCLDSFGFSCADSYFLGW